MARPKKKPEFNSEDVSKQIIEAITDAYLNPTENTADEDGKMYINQLADEFGMSRIKLRKILITAGAYETPMSRQVNELYKSGKPVNEIQIITGLSAASVSGYLPYRKTIYNLEESTLLAERLRKYRNRKAAVNQLALVLNGGDLESTEKTLWNTLALFEGYLYERGEVKTEKYKGVLWHTQIIKSILKHPVYIGHMVQGRKKQSFYEGKRQTYVDEANWIIVRNTHEPIVDEALFEAVQVIAKQKKSEYHERLGKFSHLEHTENILQGLVWCPNCQRPLVRYKNVSHGKKLWYTFICPGHADDPARCDFVSIREDELSKVLFTVIQTQIAIAADLEDVVKRLNAQPDFRRQRSDAASKLEAARRTLKRNQSLYDSLYQNYVEQLMTEQEYVTLKARYKEETEQAEQLIAALEQEQRESKVYTAENRFLTEFRSFMGTDTLTKEMATALVERIYVDADKNIDIRLRYRDEYIALTKFIEGRAAV